MGHNNKKKILLVITPLVADGGVLTNLENWAPSLNKNYHLRILTFCNNSEILEYFHGIGIDMVHSPVLGSIGRAAILPGVIRISREINEFNPDLIVSVFVWSDFLVSVARAISPFRRKKIPHIAHVNGDPAFVMSAGKKLFYEIIARFVYNRANEIIFISRQIALDAIRHYGAEESKVHIVFNGVKEEFISDAPRVNHHSPLSFGIVARLSEEKNIDVILRALIRAADITGKKIQVHIFGDGPERQRLESIARKEATENVFVFHGWVNNVIDAYKEVDWNLIYSDYEGMNRSTFESGARCVPTIGNRVGGVPEGIMHNETGFVVDSEQELLETIVHVMKNESLCITMGNNAREFAIRDFLLEDEINKLCRIFDDAISS